MDVIYSIKDIVNNIVITYMIVYGYWTYHDGDHFIMYPNVKSQCNTSETNIILCTPTTFQLEKKFTLKYDILKPNLSENINLLINHVYSIFLCDLIQHHHASYLLTCCHCLLWTDTKMVPSIAKIYHKVTTLPEHSQSDAVSSMLFRHTGKRKYWWKIK